MSALMQAVLRSGSGRGRSALGSFRSHLPMQRAVRPLLSRSRRPWRDDDRRSQIGPPPAGRGRHVVPDLQRRRTAPSERFLRGPGVRAVAGFDVKLKTNGLQIGEQAAARIRALGVRQVSDQRLLAPTGCS